MPAWQTERIDEETIGELSRSLLLSPLEARLLIARGITTFEAGDRYLNPSLDHLHDPFLFAEMREAASLIHRTVTSGGLILVHGDYDADGICGTALIYETLRGLGANVQYFIPDRARDGYGLARRVLERGLQVGLELLVSVDCGSSDGELVARLAERGVKVVITDHHETNGRVPEAAAFINPKTPGETYPFTELAGSGVAFKLVQGLEKVMGVDLSLADRLDLVAVGTLGDYTPLGDESRAMVSMGLAVLERWRRPGLKALRIASGIATKGFSARTICFTIIPRLNSPGRMGSARDVVELLLTDDDATAARMAEEIEAKNRRRQAHDAIVTDEASYLADIVLKRSEPSALVFASSSWHEGVVGIGAARLAERYRLPSALIAVKEGVGKGSVRSAGVVNVKEALERCSALLEGYGGHREAGGFTIREDRIVEFQRAFEEAVGELADGGTSGGVPHADAELTIGEATLDLASFIERMAPFGPGNHEPIFLLRDLTALPGTRIVGDGHLKLSAVDREGAVGNLICFSMGKAWPPNRIVGKRIDVMVHLRPNVYRGRTEPQLTVTAMRFAEEAVPA